MVRIDIDWNLLQKLGDTAKTLNVFNYNSIKLINSICDKSLAVLRDFKALFKGFFEFLNQEGYNHTYMAEFATEYGEKYFIKSIVDNRMKNGKSQMVKEVSINLSEKLVRKIKQTGEILNVNPTEIGELLSLICDKILEINDDFKKLLFRILEFLDQEGLSDSKMASIALKLERNYFKKFDIGV